ncbi:MAG: SbcC/MukB-like Walker B domain-containing protein, partial [Cyclobacteriaceae bacterium]
RLLGDLILIDSKAQELEEQKREQQQSVSAAGLEIVKLVEAIDKMKDAVADAEKIYELEKNVQSYKAEREKLNAGEPCPVCGSTDHPFVAAYEPASLSEEQKKIEIRKKELEDLRANLQKIKIRSASSETLMAEVDKQLSDIRSRQETDQQALKELKLEDSLQESDNLNAELEQTRKTIDDIGDKINQLEVAQKEQNRLREKIDELKDIITGEREKMSRSEEQVASLTGQLTRNKKKAENMKVEIDILETELASELDKFGISMPSVENSERFISAIELKISEYQEKEKLRDQLTNQLSQIAISLKNQESLLEEKRSETAELAQTLKRINGSLQEKREERRQILPDGNSISNKRQELQDGISVATKAAEKSSEFLQGLKNKQNKVTQELSLLEEEGKYLAIELKEKLKILETALSGTHFDSVQMLKESLLTHDEEREYRSVLRQLENEEIELKTRLKKWEESSNQLKAGRDFEITHEQAREAKLSLNIRKDELNEESGSIKQKIAQDNQIRQRNEQILQTITEQQKVVNKWNTLLKLIGGSKDAFNTYVQRLTLQNLIYLANIHLSKLNRRYSLEMEPEYSAGEELNFKLVDHYQADDKRLVDTSSGGEKFLISLSLALGLSDLSSHNVSVGSLFIDEGFGTLDGRTLETVIATLETLQAQGKMIGIISHVENLKERITTQIQVIKKNNGVSEVVIS